MFAMQFNSKFCFSAGSRVYGPPPFLLSMLLALG